jgi:hypothetical protein
MFQAFYIITEDCYGHKPDPYGWEGLVKKGTPVGLTYFDEYTMEFSDGHNVFSLHKIATEDYEKGKRMPIVLAASCRYCGKIVETTRLAEHATSDINCMRIRKITTD